MNIKKFRRISRGSSLLLKIFAIFSITLVIYGLYTILFGDGNFWFTYKGPSIPLFSMGGSSGSVGITDAEEKLASMIIVPFTVVVFSFILLKGSQIFTWLGKGETPFSEKFANAIKRLSLVLIIFDLLVPIIFYSVLSLISVDGYNYTIGFGSAFIIGIILFIVSEIFKYGIELQSLADETV
ncbi:DUF2975 domain-containing protein [Jeotgalibaca sp. MA1X17-3]|uniref:DUF2975 domain-containing protein n=1 Tax=Jeotgalibaca sp. MA1X17-3 TaxID=2908211 RepID=UPI001F3302F1|nr:DUF2975 domain-containing protein [Jeotgalibaca sp. MA1X17-3]UJF15864.1 DUF2975 domain-containing protein [Jeotgalibaca sp. MA1X17-3]